MAGGVRGSQIPVLRSRQHSSDSLDPGRGGGGGTATPSPGPATPNRRGGGGFFPEDQDRRNNLANYVKVVREKEELEKCLSREKQNSLLLTKQLEDLRKEEGNLRSLSEEMVKEYDLLKNKYELETGALEEAVQRATQWYKQNRQLKRKSAALMQTVMKLSPHSAIDVEDETDHASDTDEIETLRNHVQDFQGQIAKLQSELNSLRLQEFEAQEQVVELNANLEAERSRNAKLQAQLEELKTANANFDQITRLAAQEVSSLRDQCEKEKTVSMKFKSDADKAKKERNVLAHQSQILLCEAASDEKLMKALFEIENLKRTLEEERQRHSDEMEKFEEQLDSLKNESQKELLEEKLKLIESELSIALQRAERAESDSALLKFKVSELEVELSTRNSSIPPPPPPPPPPNPLFLAPSSSAPTRKKNVSTVAEMANLLGVQRPLKPTVQQGAIDEIINEIKGGRFLLKTPERKNRKNSKEEEQPPAVKEIMNVLGTLRKRPGNRTPSFKRTKNELSTASNSGGDLTV